MGLIYEKIRSIYYFLSPLARKQVKLERMILALDQKISEIDRKYVDIAQTSSRIQDNTEKASFNLDSLMECVASQRASIDSLTDILNMANSESFSVDGEADANDYINMQRNQYNDEKTSPEDIVGQYNWHENYPYETFLLYRNGDIRKPLFEKTVDKKALDFACGPGRMVKRMSLLFGQVDGCDISERMIEVAKKRVPDCNFYLTHGDDLGDVPKNYYDFCYCTISMQHIASYSIRRKILECIKNALNSEGKFTLQLAYNKDFPYVNIKGKMIINDNEVTVAGRKDMASYFSNDYSAKSTNGVHDVGIGEEDLAALKVDFEKLFKNVAVWFSNVSEYYKDLEGYKHGNYWATDWIYIYGEK